jgi:hypothetical protein
MDNETQPPSDATLQTAARAVLAADGRGFVLQPWQVAWLVATSEGRAAMVPPGCGVGKGWLDERLREASEAADPATEPG